MDDDFLTSTATKQLADLMDGKVFDNPKNVNLLLRTLKMITKFESDSIILDFFSGSATTAHAVMQLNAEDGGNRKFIMVQLPEKTDEKSEATRQDIRTSAKSARSASAAQERKSRKRMQTRRA